MALPRLQPRPQGGQAARAVPPAVEAPGLFDAPGTGTARAPQQRGLAALNRAPEPMDGPAHAADDGPAHAAPPAPFRRQPPAAVVEEKGELRGRLGKMLHPASEAQLAINPYRVQILKVGHVEHKITTTFDVTARPGDKVVAVGVWGMYKGQPSFKATVITLEMPRDMAGITTWIERLHGLGKATAKKLARHFGDDLPEAIKDADRLVEAKIPRHKAEMIAEAANSNDQVIRVHVFLSGLGLGEGMASRILSQFGLSAESIIAANPWQLATHIPGIGFKTADEIAMKYGHPKDSPNRMVAALRYALKDAVTTNGHCGLPVHEMVRDAARHTSQSEETVARYVDDALNGDVFYVDPFTRLASTGGMHEAEQGFADRLIKLLERATVSVEDAERALRQAAGKLAFKLGESQWNAAVMALTHNVCIITGGPGTGKSTILKLVVEAARILGRNVVCAAPTGRASKRLTECTGIDAATCHRLLRSRGGENSFDADNQFPEDWFVIDEFSMVDQRLGYDFFQAIRDEAGVTIVGDVDQLPPVGPGQLLRDMIASGTIPVARLDHVYRQGEDSGIIRAAHRINKGQQPIGADEPRLKGFGVRKVEDPKNLVRDIVEFIRSISDRFDPLRDIQVLTSRHPGDGGVGELNKGIKAAFNPADPDDGRSVYIGQKAFTVGDRVMQLKNSYQKKVYNGEVGTVVSVGKTTGQEGDEKRKAKAGGEPCFTVDYDGHRATYVKADVSEIEQAYAATVHKSQGCEFPVVIFVCPSQHRFMLNRNLLYTAVTRAKTGCMVFGDPAAMRHAVETQDTNHRHTGLVMRLRAMHPALVVRDDEQEHEDAPALAP